MKSSSKINYYILSTILFISLLINITLTAQTQNLEKFVGEWRSGDITFNMATPTFNTDVKNAYLRIYFIISENHGNLLAKMESPESNVLWMDANQTVVSGDTISLYFNGIKGIFEGILNKEKDQINGSLRLKGRTISIGLRKK